MAPQKGCPRCGSEMELVDIAERNLPVDRVSLCPGCYLVTWNDGYGLRVAQGIPLSKN